MQARRIVLLAFVRPRDPLDFLQVLPQRLFIIVRQPHLPAQGHGPICDCVAQLVPVDGELVAVALEDDRPWVIRVIRGQIVGDVPTGNIYGLEGVRAKHTHIHTHIPQTRLRVRQGCGFVALAFVFSSRHGI